ncbi:MAG: hypothetical protein MJA27_31920 [Pseudanabaenales cyanobacterium]|nr:hypothetical protein [Pseudanabaenales cyanobacterium]
MAVITVAEGDARVVTPGNPLVINETEVTFENVVIEGGEIIANVQTVATFQRLEKVS